MRTYRVYFNRTLEYPQVWSIDEGAQTSEINVQGFRLEGVTAESHSLAPEERAGKSRFDTPFAWLTVTGNLELRNGIAFITA